MPSAEAATAPYDPALWGSGYENQIARAVKNADGTMTITTRGGATQILSSTSATAVDASLETLARSYEGPVTNGSIPQASRDAAATLDAAGDTPKTQAVKRGLAGFAEKGGLRKAFNLFGGVAGLVVGANVMVWEHNLGYIKDTIDGGPAGTGLGKCNATQTASPTAAGAAISATATAPAIGYVLLCGTNPTARRISPGTTSEDCGYGAGQSGFDIDAGLRPLLARNASAPAADGSAPWKGAGCTYAYFEAFVPGNPTGLTGSPPTGALAGAPPSAIAVEPSSASIRAGMNAAAGSASLPEDERAAFNYAVSKAGPLTTSSGASYSQNDPTSNEVTVPSCAGLVQSTCAATLSSSGLTGDFTVATFTGADVTKPAGAVLSQNPAGGAKISQGGTVAVTVNPDEATMPRLVPAPGAGETYSAYLARLQDLGLVGSSTVLTGDTLDPTKGPNEVVRVNPQPGTRVQNGSTVATQVNPPDAAPAPGAAPGSSPAIHSINLTPLQVASPCNVFPFGVPCWVVGALGSASVSGQCPNFSQGLPFGQAVTVDGCVFDPAVSIYKPVMLWASFIGLAWLLFNVATNRGGGDD